MFYLNYRHFKTGQGEKLVFVHYILSFVWLNSSSFANQFWESKSVTCIQTNIGHKANLAVSRWLGFCYVLASKWSVNRYPSRCLRPGASKSNGMLKFLRSKLGKRVRAVNQRSHKARTILYWPILDVWGVNWKIKARFKTIIASASDLSFPAISFDFHYW